MSIPVPSPFYDVTYTDKNGNLVANAKLYNDQLFQTLNYVVLLINSLATTDISNTMVNFNGLSAPIKTTTEITALEPNVPRGTVWYNSTIKKLQFKSDDGVIETITST